eukprot:933159-Pelagomonas_calceolata.AAC.4
MPYICAWVLQEVKSKEQIEKEKKGEKVEQPKQSIWAALVQNVLKNPFIWGMALTYFMIYVVRQASAVYGLHEGSRTCWMAICFTGVTCSREGCWSTAASAHLQGARKARQADANPK